MATEKKFQCRIIQKNKTEAEWNENESFIPLKGELILYTDINRIKIGDGITTVKNLPFSDNHYITIGQLEGSNLGKWTTAEGKDTTASGNYSHAEGYKTIANGLTAHAEGHTNEANGSRSHAEGSYNIANGYGSHAEGVHNIANGYAQSVFGSYNQSENLQANQDDKGQYIEIVGNGYAETEGNNTIEYRSNARTLDWNGNEVLSGKLTVGINPENNMDVATKSYVDEKESQLKSLINNINNFEVSIVNELPTENIKEYTIYFIQQENSTYDEYMYINNQWELLGTTKIDLSGYMQKGIDYITAGQKSNTTLGLKATAEGNNTTASGRNSHAEGDNVIASGLDSHAEGTNATASGNYSHAEGNATTANSRSQHVFGEYNIPDLNSHTNYKGTYIEIVGNGTGINTLRSNARTLDWDGNEWLAGTLTVSQNPENDLDVATKEYVDSYYNDIVDFLSNMTTFTVEIVNELPTEDIKENTIYFTPNNSNNNENIYNEYMYINQNWELVGSTEVNLSNYMVKGTDYITSGKRNTTTLGSKSTAEGYNTEASGNYSHAENYFTTASGENSHTEGFRTIASRKSQHVFGEFNIEDTDGANGIAKGKYIEIVGNGNSINSRSNARTLDWNGNEEIAGRLTVGSNPINAMDVATKSYVDNTIAGTGQVPMPTTDDFDKIYTVNRVPEENWTTFISGSNVSLGDTLTPINSISNFINKEIWIQATLQQGTYLYDDGDIDEIILGENEEYIELELDQDIFLRCFNDGTVDILEQGESIGDTNSFISINIAFRNILPIPGWGENLPMYQGINYVTAGQKENTTLGEFATAEGHNTTASGNCSHAEGSNTIASGNWSHVEGTGTEAGSDNQHVFGRYNIVDSNNQYVEIVGNGISNSYANARTLDWEGNEVLAGKLTVGAGPLYSMDVATKSYVDTHYRPIKINNSNLVSTVLTASSNTPLTLKAGNNITLSESNGVITINAVLISGGGGSDIQPMSNEEIQLNSSLNSINTTSQNSSTTTHQILNGSDLPLDSDGNIGDIYIRY